MSTLAIHAAPFESSNSKEKKKNIFPKPSSSVHKKTQKFREGMKIDKTKIQNILDDIHDAALEDSDDDAGDFTPPPPPISSGSERTKSKNENDNINYNDEDYNDQGDSDDVTPRTSTSFKENFASIRDSGQILNHKNDNYISGHKNNNFNDENIQSNSSTYLGNNDLLIKKINYMTQLLEDQHDEKTNNVTEEVVLYCFLGVFMIFIVDSFSKIGKYTR